MADTREFFDRLLPEKLQSNPNLGPSLNVVYQFDITGAGTWTVDLTDGTGSVSEGPHPAPSCVITVAQAHWEQILDKPSLSMQLFMMGKLQGSNAALAMALQKLLA